MGFVNVPVPEERVSEVYALLGRSRQENGASSGRGTELEWDRALIERMYLESPRAMKAFLDRLVNHAGETFSAPEMAQAIGREPQQLAGVLGAFGRRVKNRYGMEIWPFHAAYDHTEQRYMYRMDPSTAGIIRNFRNNR